MIVYKIIVCLLVAFIAKQKDYNSVRFPIDAELNHSIIETEPVLIGKSTRLLISGDYLVFFRGKAENMNLCSFFDYPSLNYIGDYGNFGRGPNEFPYPDVQNAVATDSGFALFDMIKGFVFINVHNLINGCDFIYRQIRTPGELYMLNDAHIINDSVIIGMPYMGNAENMYVIYNTHRVNINYFGEYPDIFGNKSSNELWAAFWRHSTVKPDGTAIASFFDSQKLLRIYSSAGKLLKEVMMKPQRDYFSDKYRNREGLTHYYKVVNSTDKYLYALCYNAKLKNFLETHPVIEVWDWNGKPVARFRMGNSVLTFEVTPDDDKIFCIDNQTSNKIYVYNIGDILRQ
ncbi:MAG: BF3164 family lipoprotein [Bacteroidales bacterium]|nr:BF3164 family lipoprotein [Bacteroidales bacterium]